MDKEISFIARPGFTVRKIAGEYMLVPMNTGGIRLSDRGQLPDFNGIIELNELALFLYNTLSTPKTFSELLQAVNQEYDTTGQNVKSDINEFLDKAIKNQLIFILYENDERKNENENI